MEHLSETEIVTPLMADPRFAAFYQAERGTFPIGWNVGADCSIPADAGAMFLVQYVPPGRTLRAVLLRARPTVEMAQTVAHEVMHFVILNEGYPYAWCGDGADDATVARVAKVANVPHDLLIAERLARYGFPPKPIGPDAALCYRRGFRTPTQMRALLEHLLDRAGLWRVAFVR